MEQVSEEEALTVVGGRQRTLNIDEVHRLQQRHGQRIQPISCARCQAAWIMALGRNRRG
jgi:hypothetical protein